MNIPTPPPIVNLPELDVLDISMIDGNNEGDISLLTPPPSLDEINPIINMLKNLSTKELSTQTPEHESASLSTQTTPIGMSDCSTQSNPQTMDQCTQVKPMDLLFQSNWLRPAATLSIRPILRREEPREEPNPWGLPMEDIIIID
jgi:hypothetical protein